MARKNQDIFLSDMTYGRRLFILAVIFVLALSLLGFVIGINPAWSKPTSRNDIAWVAVVQDLVVFVAPAVVAAFIFSRRPISFLSLDRRIGSVSLSGIFLMFIVGIPALNQIVWWNSQITFPPVLADLENVFRQMESSASETTDILLSSVTFRGLCLEILIIGILAPLSEELFFRGALQRLVGSGHVISPHLAIWITAFIFSLVHFQFFGFVPRMLLGAFFGYLLYWTGSLWAPVAAHILNNTLVVVTRFIILAYPQYSIPEDLGVTYHGFPWPAAVSAVLLIVVLLFFRKVLFYHYSGKRH